MMMWECSINEMATFIYEFEQDCIAHELQESIADEQALPWREDAMYYEREDVDPFWPAPGVEQFLETDVEMVPIWML